MIGTAFVKSIFVEDDKLTVVIKDETGWEEEAIIYGNSSVESWPLVGDEVAFIVSGDENIIIASYRDIGGIDGGETRIYSRDSEGNTKASLVLGTDGVVNVNGGGDSLTLTSKVDDFISKIDGVLRGWTVAAQDGGLALQSAYKSQFGSPPDSMESETVRVDK